MITVLLAFGLGYALGTQRLLSGDNYEELVNAAQDIAGSEEVRGLMASVTAMGGQIAQGGLETLNKQLRAA